jgi:quercetin dioxygenase-like cupin family protein
MPEAGSTRPTDDVLLFLDSLLAIRADAERTGGRLGVSESWAPRGHASPLHVHSREDEAFFVIDGELQFWLGDGPPSRYRSGGLAWLPRSLPHAFVVTSPTARFLTIMIPGGFEDLFRTGTPTESREIPGEGSADPAGVQRAGAALIDLRVRILGPTPAS